MGVLSMKNALWRRYRRYLHGELAGSTLQKRAEIALQPHERRIKKMQMALFYAICDQMVDDGVLPRVVGSYVNHVYLTGFERPPASIAPAVKAYFRVMRDCRSYAQRAIARINPYVDAAGVEGSMRMQYGTLDHLSHDAFVAEIELARHCEAQEPGYLRAMAESYGTYPRWLR